MSSNHEVLSVLFLFREYQNKLLSEYFSIKDTEKTNTQINELKKIGDDLEKKIILLMDD